MRHQLVGLLAGSVQAHRVVHRVVHREGHLGVGPVHAGAAGVHQVFHPVLPASLQHVANAHQVALQVGPGVLQRVAHPGLRGQVDHALRPVAGKQRVQARGIGNVAFGEGKARVGAELCQPGMLQARVVVRVEVVDADDLIAALQQLLGHVHADEAGAAGDEDFHGEPFSRCRTGRGCRPCRPRRGCRR